MTLLLNLADQLANFPISRLNGPGLRYAFWVQGCSIRCTDDCLNPNCLDPAPKVLVPVDEAAAHILRLQVQHGIEGVTFLGGEPFDQAEALAELGRRVQAAGLSVVTYTGHTLEHLQRQARPDWLALLAVTDILIDGPFVPQLRSDSLRWRGSSNQRLIFLTDRYRPEEIEATPVEKGFNILIRPDGTLTISGLQNKQALETLLQTWQEDGWIE